MTYEETLEDIDALADTLLNTADLENVGRIAHKILRLFSGQPRADCWVAIAFALANGTEDGSEGAASGVFLAVARVFQRFQEGDIDDH